jgi:hypothetical protein
VTGHKPLNTRLQLGISVVLRLFFVAARVGSRAKWLEHHLPSHCAAVGSGTSHGGVSETASNSDGPLEQRVLDLQPDERGPGQV